MSGPSLHVELDVKLPETVAVGDGTAIFVCGWCFSPQAEISSLEFVLDGEPQPVDAHGMPRLDPFREVHPGLDPFAGASRDPESTLDPELHSYRSGFWGLVRVARVAEPVSAELLLQAALQGGGTATASLGALALTPGARAAGDGGPLVAISMATYEPPPDLFEQQVDSIRAQSCHDWVCYVSDDGSSPRSFERLEEAIGDDPRFVVSRSPRRLGFYGNFERALSMVPAGAKFVAMADQDDRWHPHKLEALLNSIDGAQLVYSDARIVDRDGQTVSDSYWSRRRNNHSDLTSLFIANSVTGAASLFRRELLDTALPFPPAQFAHYHDHWIALTAFVLGEIGFVPEPLYDYVQHGEAWLGHATANRMPSLRDRIGGLRARGLRERIAKWRMHYFVDVARLMQFATILELRCGERIASSKRRVVRRFARADDSPVTIARLVARGTRELVGRPETLGAEWMVALALLWRRALPLSARRVPQRRLRLDAVPPPDLAPRPQRVGAAGDDALTGPLAIANKVAPLELDVRADAPTRINLLIPTIDLHHLFGGYIAKFNLARRLAERGHRVRVLTVDPVGPLPRSWKRSLESFSGLAGLTERVEVEFGREADAVSVSPTDGFIATTWWTAHIAADAARAVGAARFVYLIQEYEPFTFPMGTYAALAEASYGFDHFAVFSSELLRDYFCRHALGAYARGSERGDQDSVSFQNAITRIEQPDPADLAARQTRRLLFYARPEEHAARNLFELGVLALSRAVGDGAFSGWELRGIGSVTPGGRLALGGGATLELLPRSSQDDYARLLSEHDVGLALMYTPHPSLVPIEMASAGMLTVTNTFENKTAEALAEISPNLIAAAPAVNALAEALGQAGAEVGAFERRVRGADVRWSRDWNDSFDDAVVDRIASVAGERR